MQMPALLAASSDRIASVGRRKRRRSLSPRKQHPSPTCCAPGRNLPRAHWSKVCLGLTSPRALLPCDDALCFIVFRLRRASLRHSTCMMLAFSFRDCLAFNESLPSFMRIVYSGCLQVFFAGTVVKWRHFNIIRQLLKVGLFAHGNKFK